VTDLSAKIGVTVGSVAFFTGFVAGGFFVAIFPPRLWVEQKQNELRYYRLNSST
jgi:hypothetical protein